MCNWTKVMVEKFGYDVTAITFLYLINLIANIFVAPYIGRFIKKMGERTTLIIEYIGLIGVFVGYAVVDDHVHDTVGVVVLDKHGNVASTVSSGGIALKQPGRVGQASCFGCGCWAQRRIKENINSTAVSTTGT